MPRKKKSKRKTRKTPDLSYLEILDLFIRLYKENGCPPPLSCMQEITGKGAFVRKSMKRLRDEGYVMQPYRGSYRPLKDSNGDPVEIAVSVGGVKEAAEENTSPAFAAFNRSLFELIREVAASEGAGTSPSEDEVSSLVSEHIEALKKEVGFHLEAGESKTRKLTETLEGLLDLPESLSALQEEVDLLQGERGDLREMSKSLKEMRKSVETLSSSVEKLTAWREGMAKMFSG